MKTCAVCSVQFNDGAQCASCKNELDFGCASISESGWRKLGVDRRAQWKCPTCRVSSPAVSTPQTPATLDTILSEVRAMKRQLLSLPTLIEDIKSVKTELVELKNACAQSNESLEYFDKRLAELETKAADFDRLQDIVDSLQAELTSTKNELLLQEQRSRLNKVEIKAVPLKKRMMNMRIYFQNKLYLSEDPDKLYLQGTHAEFN